MDPDRPARRERAVADAVEASAASAAAHVERRLSMIRLSAPSSAQEMSPSAALGTRRSSRLRSIACGAAPKPRPLVLGFCPDAEADHGGSTLPDVEGAFQPAELRGPKRFVLVDGAAGGKSALTSKLLLGGTQS